MAYYFKCYHHRYNRTTLAVVSISLLLMFTTTRNHVADAFATPTTTPRPTGLTQHTKTHRRTLGTRRPWGAIGSRGAGDAVTRDRGRSIILREARRDSRRTASTSRYVFLRYRLHRRQQACLDSAFVCLCIQGGTGNLSPHPIWPLQGAVSELASQSELPRLQAPSTDVSHRCPGAVSLRYSRKKVLQDTRSEEVGGRLSWPEGGLHNRGRIECTIC